jgi:hypothetical protein
LWRDIQIDPKALAELPEEGVPPHIQPTAVDAPELARLIAADRSGYAKGWYGMLWFQTFVRWTGCGC